MAAPSRIVSFDEARRNTRAIPARSDARGGRRTSSDRYSDSQNLSNIFKLDFVEDGSANSVASPSGPRQAIFSEDDLIEEEGGAAPAKGPAGLLRKISDARKSKAKRNAERAFEKSYGGTGAGGASEGGPRAALHTGNMGASQKKAMRIQGGRGAGFSLGGFSLPSISLPHLSHAFKRNVTIVACAIAAIMLFGSIYTPAQQYYQQIRERDRLSAEYELVQERNEVLQANVDRLGTDEGLEDKAHAEFGLVKPDEETASVIGIEVDSSPDFHANVTPGSVPAPETWYSGLLDVLFMYDRG